MPLNLLLIDSTQADDLVLCGQSCVDKRSDFLDYSREHFKRASTKRGGEISISAGRCSTTLSGT